MWILPLRFKIGVVVCALFSQNIMPNFGRNGYRPNGGSVMSTEPYAGLLERTYKKGEVVISANDEANDFFTIISGKVGAYINYGLANQIKVGELTVDEFFGEAAIISNMRRSATVVALEDTILRVVEVKNIKNAMQSDPDIFISLIEKNYHKQVSRNEDTVQISSLMEDINAMNEEMLELNKKIIKCLDEIQVISQSNFILSVNASIEAARIGRLGGGFIVVAEELRNISTKTTNLAKTSNELSAECRNISLSSSKKFKIAREFLKKFK